MFKLSRLCFATLIFLQASFAPAQAAPVDKGAEEALARQLDAALAPLFKADEPGAAVIVTRNGEKLFSKGYGLANIEKREPMRADMTLPIASMTKQFTAVAIMLLADEGKLAVSDDITKFLPDYPTHGRNITIEHLLTHTSGIASFTNKANFLATMTRDVNVSQMIDSFKNDPLVSEPGAVWDYNNSGYFLLGAIIEKLSGQAYADFLDQRIFRPLGMTRTAFHGRNATAVSQATGYVGDDKKLVPAIEVSMTQAYSTGALVSTVDDLARWDAAIAAGKLLKPATWKRVFTPYRLTNGEMATSGYAFGWMTGKFQGSRMIAHGGDLMGFSSHGLSLPRERIYVAVLSNARNGVVAPPDFVASTAAGIVLGKPLPTYTPVVLDAKALDAFVGVYRDSATLNRFVSRENDRLLVQYSDGGSTVYRPYSDTGFLHENRLTRIEFAKNPQGEVTHMQLFHRGSEKVMARTSATLPAGPKGVSIDNAVFDAYVGQYSLAPGMALEVSRAGDRFFIKATGQDREQLLALSDSTFFLKAANAQIRFGKDADGKVEQLVLTQGGRDMPAKKIN